MKKNITPFIFLFAFFALPVLAEAGLATRLSGLILLQVEDQGRAWYVNPIDLSRYYLGSPDSAFALMRRFGLGITDDNLKKIPVGLIPYNDNDDDKDGLSNRLETAMGTDPLSADSDLDGFDDQKEVESSYDPAGSSILPIDKNFTEKNLGKIFLQVEKNGEAWYINPGDQKRYYLGRPADAWLAMRSLSLGISNADLQKISQGKILASTPISQPSQNPSADTPAAAISAAAQAIRQGDALSAQKYFIPEMAKRLEYTITHLDAENRFTFGNLLSGAKAVEVKDDTATYKFEAYFSLGDQNVPVIFDVKKQADGKWLIANL